MIARREESGFTLLESLVAMSIMGMLFAGILPAFLLCSQITGRNENRSEAISAARLTIENLREQDIPTLPTSGSTGPVSMIVGGHTYSVLTRYCVDTSLCPAETRHVTVEVSFAGTSVYTLESIFTVLN